MGFIPALRLRFGAARLAFADPSMILAAKAIQNEAQRMAKTKEFGIICGTDIPGGVTIARLSLKTAGVHSHSRIQLQRVKSWECQK